VHVWAVMNTCACIERSNIHLHSSGNADDEILQQLS